MPPVWMPPVSMLLPRSAHRRATLHRWRRMQGRLLGAARRFYRAARTRGPHVTGGGVCRVVFWVQHGALVEERSPEGALTYRRGDAAPDAFAADGAAICDSDDEDLVPAVSQRAEPEHACKPFLPVRSLPACQPFLPVRSLPPCLLASPSCLCVPFLPACLPALPACAFPSSLPACQPFLPVHSLPCLPACKPFLLLFTQNTNARFVRGIVYADSAGIRNRLPQSQHPSATASRPGTT